MFDGSPSEYIWEDADGTIHIFQQAEGGEQGDAMMPLLYALGQHSALESIASQLQPDEHIFAFLDDIYVVAQPGRIAVIYQLIKLELWQNARIRIHTGKTKCWNKIGAIPKNLADLCPNAWKQVATFLGKTE